MREGMKKTLIVLTALLIGGGLFWLYNLNPERRFGCFSNQHASCLNCRHQFVMALRQHLSSTGDKWLPRGGKTPADSLAQFYSDQYLAKCFTSHALSGKLYEYYKKHGTLTYDFMCYRYNEGLSIDDPQELIVFYFHKPTRWSSWGRKEGFLGRPVMTLDISPAWEFLPEQEFQKRQAATLEYMRERAARQPDEDAIRESLLLLVDVESLRTNVFRFTAKMTNRGDEVVSVHFRDNGSLGGSALFDQFEDRPDLNLSPGEAFRFPGWREVAITDTIRDGGITGRHSAHRGLNSKGSGSHGYGSPRPLEEVNKEETIQASIGVRVRTAEIKTIDLVIRSPRVQSMMEDAHNKTREDIGASCAESAASPFCMTR